MDRDNLTPEERERLDSINAPTPERADDEQSGGSPGFARNDWAGANKAKNTKQVANKAAGFYKKNKALIWGGTSGLAIAGSIALFFMWMMLFKNVHIKNLYVTYRWAQFNRGLNKVVKAQLEYAKANPDAAKPTGTADTVVSPTDTPENISRNTNAERFSPDVVDPADPGAVQGVADDVTRLAQSIEGPSETVLKNAGASRTVKPADGEGATPEERARSAEDKAKSNVEETLKGDETLGDPPDKIKAGVDEAKNSEKPRAQALEDGATKVLDGDGWTGKLSKASTAVFMSTMYCIFSDLWTSGKKELAKIAVDMSIVNAQEVNKTASCQQLGDCNMAQVSAVSEKYDNEEESSEDACGRARAEQRSLEGCVEIDDRFVVNGIAKEIGGAGGTTLTTVDAILDPPFSLAGFGVDDACSYIMNPVVQGGVTLAEGALIFATGGGWAAVGKGVTAGAATAAGTAGGKALIATYIAKYTGDAYEKLTPHDMGNLTDMGNLAMASGSCKAADCVQVSGAQYAQLNKEYRTELIAANSKRSVLEKFFDTDSSDSVVSRVVLSAPANPAAFMGRIKSMFANIANPTILTHTLGKNIARHGSQTAYAAAEDGGAEAYGLTNGLFVPPPLMSDASDYASVVEWGKTANLDQIAGTFSEICGPDSSYDTNLDPDAGQDCLWDNLNSQQKMYKQYKYIQGSAFYTALWSNKQSNLPSGSSSGSQETTNAPGPVFLLGDSITNGLNAAGITTMFEDKEFKPTTLDASDGRSFTGAGSNNAKTSAFSALDDSNNKKLLQEASYVFVGLGTNPAGNTNLATYERQIGETIDKIKAAPSTAKIYWMNVFSPGITQRNERNAVLAKQAAAKGFTVIDTAGLDIKTTDTIHPTGPEAKRLAEYIVQTMTAGGSGSATGVTGDRASLNARLLGNQLLKLGAYQSAEVQRNDIANGIVTDGLVKAMLMMVEQGKIALPVNALKSDHSPGTLHGAGKAIDIGYRGGDATGNQLFKFIYDNRQVMKVDELIWNPAPAGYKCIDKGNPVDCYAAFSSVMASHKSHIHMGTLE